MASDLAPATVLIGNTEIDSALVAALREPRERMALLRLEQVLVELLQSETDGWIEVGGPYNSRVLWPSNRPLPANSYPPTMRQTTFQRCILHRLADRFGIVREAGSLLQMPSQEQGAIRLIKLPDSKIPRPLLQDMDASLYTAEPEQAASKQQQQQLQQQQPPRKMKIMKRSDNNLHRLQKAAQNKKNDAAAASRKSLSDKEKAYAEARARIFQEEQGENNNTTGANQASTADSAATTDAVTQGMAKLQTSPERAALYQHQSSSLRSSTGSLNSSSVNNNNSETERKAVYRNYAEEAADPDFRRGVAVVVPVHASGLVPVQAQQSSWPQLPGSRRGGGASLTASAPAFVPTKNTWRPTSS